MLVLPSQLYATDAGVSMFLHPTGDACGFGSAELIEVEITNFSVNPIPMLGAVLEVDGVASSTESVPGTLAPGATVNYTFTTTADLSAAGPHVIRAWSVIAADTDPTNDTLSITVSNDVGVSLPVDEFFDSYPNGATTFGGSVFFNDSSPGLPWEVNSGSTFTGFTGPNDDASGGGKYIYMESSDGFFGSSARLRSGCINLTAGINPRVIFAYHLYGAAIDRLVVQAHSGGTIDTVLELVGPQQFASSDPWIYDTIDLSAYNGSSVELWWIGSIGIGGSWFEADMALDEIQINDPVPNDVSVLSIVDPVPGCGLGNAEDISVDVINYGLNDQFAGFNMGYSVNGPTGSFSGTDVFTDTLLSGETKNFVFGGAAVDFSFVGTYNVKIWTELAGDDNTTNDTLDFDFIIPGVALPSIELFDSYADGIEVFPDWINLTDDELTWETNSGPTGSTLTGPDDDASGGGSYIYMETSSPAVFGDRARLRSQCISLTSGTDPEFVMAYHMYGDAIGELNVDIVNSDSSTNVINLVGQQQFDNPDPWLYDTVDLTPWLGGTFEILIEGSMGFTGTSFYADISLDELQILNPLPDDIGVSEVTSPIPVGCDLGAADTVKIVISNFGTTALGGFDVAYSIDGPLGPALVVENVGSLTIPSGGTAPYTFATPVDLSSDGVYTIKAYTILGSDFQPINDTTIYNIENATAISTFPWATDFEAFSDCGTTCTSDCSSAVAGGWIQAQDDDGDWLPNFGTTSSTSTGPQQDHNPGTSAGIYLYTEASGSCTNTMSRIISPCIDISSMTLPGLEFWYHMYGVDMGTLAVDYSTDGGLTWTEIWSRSGQDQLSSADPYKPVVVSLVGLGPVLQLSFRGVTGTTFNSDMAIDDVTVRDIPPFNDLTMVDVVQPGSGCGLTSSTTIGVSIRNTGTTVLSGFDVSYDITGAATASAIDPVGSFTLVPGELDTFFFPTTADLSALGIYNIEAQIILATDTFAFNDSVIVVIENVPIVTAPISDDFDLYTDGETDFDFLSNDISLVDVFEANNGPTTSTGTGPDTDASGIGSYIYMESSIMGTGDLARVCTDCVDLSVGAGNPRVGVAYHMFGLNTGSLKVDVVNDAGDSTNLMTLVGQQQFSNAAPWIDTLLDLTPFVPQTVQICFTGEAGGSVTSDISLDNIRIEDPFGNDVAVVDIVDPLDACQLGNAETISVEVANLGVIEQTNFMVSYLMPGGSVVSEMFTDTIADGEVVLFTFATPADFSTVGTYDVQAWTNLLSDANPANDTTLRTVTHVVTVDTYPYVQDFELDAQGWVGSGTNSSWELDEPTGAVISSAASGINAWVTNPNGAYPENERSTVVSPCFDFSGVDNPGITFMMNYDMEAGIVSADDGVVLQSSVDGGLSWKRVGAVGDPDGWFNYVDVLSNPGDQIPDLSEANGWSGPSFGWTTTRHALDGLGGETQVILRWAFASDATVTGQEGYAFDDVIIVDMPAVSLGPDTTVCAGFVLDAGNPGASFDWSSGETTQTITVTSSGFYEVTVTDAYGFSVTDGINVTILPSPTVSLGPDLTVCDGVTLDAANPGADFFWSTGATSQTIDVTSSGTYSVTVSTGPGCTGTDDIDVTVNFSPEALFTYTLSGGWAEFFDASTGATSWSWDFGDGTGSTSQFTDHIYTTSGNYVVTLIVENACGTDTLQQSIAIFASGLDAEDMLAAWDLYPNPSQGYLQIQLGFVTDGKMVPFQVFDASGRLHEQGLLNRNDQLDLSHLPSGQYMLQVQYNERQASKSFSIER
jgi:hypothetical protein